jgi:hypothetical protein
LIYNPDRKVEIARSPSSQFIQETLNGKVFDYEGNASCLQYNGWCNPGSLTLKGVGYQIDDQEPVFDINCLKVDSGLSSALNASNVRRCYNVNVPVANLTPGCHQIQMLALAYDGTNSFICQMDAW